MVQKRFKKWKRVLTINRYRTNLFFLSFFLETKYKRNCVLFTNGRNEKEWNGMRCGKEKNEDSVRGTKIKFKNFFSFFLLSNFLFSFAVSVFLKEVVVRGVSVGMIGNLETT